MKKKIAFVLPNLLTGGSQRAVLRVLELLDGSKYSLNLIVLNKTTRNYGKNRTGSKELALTKSGINVYRLDASSTKFSFLACRRVIQDEKFDYVVTTISYVNLYFGIMLFFFPLGRNCSFIARETNVLSVKHRNHKYRVLLKYLFAIAFKAFDKIIAQSNDMKDDLIENFHVSSDKVVTISNPAIMNSKVSGFCDKYPSALAKRGSINFCTLGHLTYQKGLDILIRAVSIMNDQTACFHIIGRGQLLEDLSLLAKNLKVDSQFVFYGFQEDPWRIMKCCDYFVFPSRFEGFPNAVIEAATLGLPIVASDCPGGLNEIINSTNGVLFRSEDPNALAEALIQIQSIEFDKSKIVDDIALRYGPENIRRLYGSVFI